MKTPLVCRSCGETEPVDLAAVADKIICTVCEHESPTGDAVKRRAIQAQQTKIRTLSWIGGLLAALALALVGTLVFLLGPESSMGTILFVTAAPRSRQCPGRRRYTPSRGRASSRAGQARG